MSGYREDRRIEAVKGLTAVTKNEAGAMTDIMRERRYELERDAIATDIRRRVDGPKRKFADLVKKPPTTR